MCKYGYVDVDKLIEYANNSRVGIDANDIARFPKADVKPVERGEWLEGSYMQPCSVCKYRGRKSWHYCPNCGADMRKGE